MTPERLAWSKEIEQRLAPHAGAYLAEFRKLVRKRRALLWRWPGDVLTIVQPQLPAGCVPELHILAAEGRGLVDAWPVMIEWARAHGFGVMSCETQKAGMVRLLTRIGWEPFAVRLKIEVDP